MEEYEEASKVIQRAFVLLSIGDNDDAKKTLAEWLDVHTSESTSPISRRHIKEALS